MKDSFYLQFKTNRKHSSCVLNVRFRKVKFPTYIQIVSPSSVLNLLPIFFKWLLILSTILLSSLKYPFHCFSSITLYSIRFPWTSHILRDSHFTLHFSAFSLLINGCEYGFHCLCALLLQYTLNIFYTSSNLINSVVSPCTWCSTLSIISLLSASMKV